MVWRERRSTSSGWLGDCDRFSVVNESGLEAIDGDILVPGADLDREVFVSLPEDLVGAVVRGLKWGLLKLSSDEDKPGCVQADRDVILDVTLGAGRDWSEIADSFTELPKVLVNRCFWSILDEIAGDCQWGAVNQFG